MIIKNLTIYIFNDIYIQMIIKIKLWDLIILEIDRDYLFHRPKF